MTTGPEEINGRVDQLFHGGRDCIVVSEISGANFENSRFACGIIFCT